VQQPLLSEIKQYDDPIYDMICYSVTLPALVIHR
jgi:hypothetical protein